MEWNEVNSEEIRQDCLYTVLDYCSKTVIDNKICNVCIHIYIHRTLDEQLDRRQT